MTKHDILDLHGVRHHEVKRKVDEFLYGSMMKNITNVDIITGNSKRMIDIVVETIKEYGFNYELGTPLNGGFISVSLI